MKYIVTLNGKKYEVEVTESEAVINSITDANETQTTDNQTQKSTPINNETVSVSGINITSPMPGTILSVNVSVGQKVSKGDVLIVLEAMKMENDITAVTDGTVKQILVTKGSSVNTDDILVVI